MLTCGDEGTILSCSFINFPDMKVVYASEVFEMGRQWKDKRLIYDTVKNMQPNQDGNQPLIAITLNVHVIKGEAE